MSTEIPPDFPITYCKPGTADGIEPQVIGSTGRKGAPLILFREPIGFGGKKGPIRIKQDEHREYMRLHQQEKRAKKKSENSKKGDKSPTAIHALREECLLKRQRRLAKLQAQELFT